jgi:hypothetical protein
MGKKSHTQEPVTRRNLLRKGAAGALGAAAATAITATPASAADGDPVILGQDNVASSPTQIRDIDNAAQLVILPGSGRALVGYSFFIGPVISGYGGGTGVYGESHGFGIHGWGDRAGVYGYSTGNTGGIGVHGFTPAGTAVKAEVERSEIEGTAFEAVGPVKFSTSGLADVSASTDRVTVNPGVPMTSQSKVLAMLQGNSGNKSMVEHVELNPVARTFQVVLTKASARPVQIAWFLIS